MKWGVACLAGAVLCLTACSEPRVGPTTKEFSEERKALAARVAREKAKKAKGKGKGRTKKVAKAGKPSEMAFGSIDTTFSYDARGRRDPFRSFEWDRLEQEVASTRGPLEQFDVSQLSLVAVVWKTGTARALVQDPSGQGYIIGEGARIGKNDGRVIGIDDNLVVVRETYVDYLGQETTKELEMRIRRSEGG